MKIAIVSILVLLGIYWLFAHYSPIPFSHEQLGLYQHDIHRIVGVVFLIVATIVWFAWHPYRPK
jgi:hypothetical protein